MKTFTTLALAATLAASFAGAGFAQSSMSNMSATDKATMTKCQGMGDSAMKADKDCTALMQKYPDAAKGTTGMNSQGATTGGTSGSPGTSSGSSGAK